jgi:hypothetical protein
MQMMLSTIIALTLFWVSASNAEIQTSIIGCNFNAIASQPGFNAVLYNYDRPQTTVYSDPAFYAGGFQKGNVAGTASGVTNIAFSIPGGAAKVYGVDVDGSNFAMDYTGYFRRTYLHSNKTPFTSQSGILLTQKLFTIFLQLQKQVFTSLT